MAFQAVPDTAEIIIRYVQNGEDMNNVFHAEKSGGYELADLTTLAEVVDLDVDAWFLPEQTHDTAYQDTTVRGLAFENDQEVVVNTSTGVGVRLADGLPNNVTLSIKKLSGQTGRSARGRLYWIGIPVDQLSSNENVMLSASVALIEAAVEGVRLGIAATVWNPVIVSRFSGGVAREQGVTFNWVDSLAVNNNIDTQRRRLSS